MSVGYSGKPLGAKLGIKSGMSVVALRAPGSYKTTLGPLPEGVAIKNRLAGRADLIHFFVKRRGDLERELARLARAMAPGGMLWISWPKGTSNIATDLSGNIVRSTVLKKQKTLVDIKVCAVDEDWSALKFVRRGK